MLFLELYFNHKRVSLEEIYFLNKDDLLDDEARVESFYIF